MFLALGLKQPFCKAIHSYQSTAKLRMCEALLLVSLHGIVSSFCYNLNNHCQYIYMLYKIKFVVAVVVVMDLAVHRSISFNFSQLSYMYFDLCEK